MPKTIPQPVPDPDVQQHREEEHTTKQQPLSGSKTVKNRNHSRQKNGEG